MNVKSNSIIRLAVIAALAGGASVSNAVVDLSSATAVKFARELPTTGLDLFNGTTDLNFSAPVTTFTPSAGQNLQVAVVLSNGAKFKGLPTLVCKVTTSAAAESATGILNLGGAGADSAVFTLSQSAIIAQVATSGAVTTACSVNLASGITVASGSHTDIRAGITYQYGTLSSGSNSAAIITWVKGASAAIVGATTLTAMVTAGFMTITNTTSVTGSLGTITYSGNGSGRIAGTDVTAGAAAAISATDILTSASITLAGDALAVAKTTGGVYLVSGTSDCVTATILASANAGASVTFGTTAGVGVDPSLSTAGYKVCITFNGTAAIPAGSITATLTGFANSGYSATTTFSANTVGTITRNGSSTRAMNIPAANNADQAFVRVTNTSAIAGKVYGTLYGQDGVVLGTANSVLATAAEFLTNATLVFDAATLKAKLGISSDWTGRAQLVITAETPAMRAQNLVRTANGTLVNVGGDTSTANN